MTDLSSFQAQPHAVPESLLRAGARCRFFASCRHIVSFALCSARFSTKLFTPDSLRGNEVVTHFPDFYAVGAWDVFATLAR